MVRVRLTLVFSIPALNLFVHTLLNLSLEDSGPCWFVVVRNFEDMCGIDVVVIPPAHDMITFYVELEDGDLQRNVRLRWRYAGNDGDVRYCMWPNRSHGLQEPSSISFMYQGEGFFHADATAAVYSMVCGNGEFKEVDDVVQDLRIGVPLYLVSEL